MSRTKSCVSPVKEFTKEPNSQIQNQYLPLLLKSTKYNSTHLEKQTRSLRTRTIASKIQFWGGVKDYHTMAYKLEKPLIRVGDLVNLWWNASLRLCAGSVEMMSTEGRTRARRIDRIELHVVLPTPPFPPTKIHFNESCSNIFCSVPSGNSSVEPINRYECSCSCFFAVSILVFWVSVLSGEFIQTVGVPNRFCLGVLPSLATRERSDGRSDSFLACNTRLPLTLLVSFFVP